MSYHCKSYYPSLYSHCRILAQEWRDRKRRRGFLCMYSKGESGIMGCVIGINGSVDKRNNPPSQCTCLFAEGIWCFRATCRCEGSSTFPSSFVFLRLFPFVLPHHLSILFSPPPSFSRVCVCVCISSVWVCDSCSLFVYILSALHIYKVERFTLNLTLNASPSFVVLPPLLFSLVFCLSLTAFLHLK